MTAQRTNAERAVATFSALRRFFAAPDGTSLYREAYPWPGDKPYAYLWPFTWALWGALDVSGMPAGLVEAPDAQRAVDEGLAGLASYWDGHTAYASYVPPPLGPGGDAYFDDNAWVGLALVQLHRLRGSVAVHGSTTALGRAEQLCAFALAGWQPAGGVRWVDAGWNHDRGAATNAGYTQLGCHLRELTGRAPRAGSGASLGAADPYDWVEACLRDPSDGLYWDKVRGDGSVDPTKWSYNQGTMLGASLRLYRLTGQHRYRARATQIADATVRGLDLLGQPASFNALFFRSLLPLYGETGAARYREAMQGYADHVWASVRDPRTGLVPFDGPSRPVTLLDQAAMVQIHALLAWDPRDYGRLA